MIAGPTGVGKTELAVCLAKALNGELLSCDSVQVYRELYIGANKWTPREDDPPQHLVNLVSWKDGFTSADFYGACQAKIHEVLDKGRVPILVGGTGFYLEWLMHGRPASPPTDLGAMLKVEQDIAQDGSWEQSLERLRGVDPEYANKLMSNDYYRLKRALSVYYALGKPLSSFTRYGSRKMADIEWHAFYLTADREYLARRIDTRCIEMLMQGLLGEVWQLRKQGLRADCPAGRAIGYAECLAFFDQIEKVTSRPLNESDEAKRLLTELVEHLQNATRQYSRRQETWYVKRKDFTWVLRRTPFQPFQRGDALIQEVLRSLAGEGSNLEHLDKEARSVLRNESVRKRMRTYRADVKYDSDLLLGQIEALIDGEELFE